MPPKIKMEEINTNDNTAKVVCRSRQAISKECEHLYTALNNVLNKSAERSSYDKSRYFQRFKEVINYFIFVVVLVSINQ